MEQNDFSKQIGWPLAAAILALVTIISMGLTLISCSEPPKTEIIQPTDLSPEEQIKRGAYLVNTSACHDCHSPKVITPNGPEPDPEKLLSSYRADMPMPEIKTEALKDWVLFNHEQTSAVGHWGVSFAANLTSDETGIGNWTEEQFLTAIRRGKYKGLEGSRPLLPPMSGR
ncbi:MAG: diheme cytochrome c-553 [Cyclobacteriaceae bacterium]|nr:diheme cytochrome c-553 [Cyclobacteriaceae bacterium]